MCKESKIVTIGNLPAYVLCIELLRYINPFLSKRATKSVSLILVEWLQSILGLRNIRHWKPSYQSILHLVFGVYKPIHFKKGRKICDPHSQKFPTGHTRTLKLSPMQTLFEMHFAFGLGVFFVSKRATKSVALILLKLLQNILELRSIRHWKPSY